MNTTFTTLCGTAKNETSLFLLLDFIAPNQIYPVDTSGEGREEGVEDGVEWPGLSSMKILSRDGIVAVNKLSCFVIFP